jgi:hypothetical protein
MRRLLFVIFMLLACGPDDKSGPCQTTIFRDWEQVSCQGYCANPLNLTGITYGKPVAFDVTVDGITCQSTLVINQDGTGTSSYNNIYGNYNSTDLALCEEHSTFDFKWNLACNILTVDAPPGTGTYQ